MKCFQFFLKISGEVALLGRARTKLGQSSGSTCRSSCSRLGLGNFQFHLQARVLARPTLNGNLCREFSVSSPGLSSRLHLARPTLNSHLWSWRENSQKYTKHFQDHIKLFNFYYSSLIGYRRDLSKAGYQSYKLERCLLEVSDGEEVPSSELLVNLSHSTNITKFSSLSTRNHIFASTRGSTRVRHQSGRVFGKTREMVWTLACDYKFRL